MQLDLLGKNISMIVEKDMGISALGIMAEWSSLLDMLTIHIQLAKTAVFISITNKENTNGRIIES